MAARSLAVLSAFGEDLARLGSEDLLAASLERRGVVLECTHREPESVEDLPRILSSSPDASVLLLSAGGLTGDDPHTWDTARHGAALASVLASARERSCTVIVANASTLDPAHTSTGASPWELAVHRLDRDLLALSQAEGLSVLDVDRCVAQVGGEDEVVGRMRYSDAMLARLADELAFILDEYGHLDDRSVLPQVGRR